MRTLALAIVALAVALALRACATRYRALAAAVASRTTITHSLALDRVRAVAQLVSSETTLRDVVVYRNVRYGATKQALVVVAGFDLDDGRTDVRIDTAARRVTITLPPPRVLAVEVTDYTTYDERAGLLNRFRPADRDTIYLLARERLARMADSSAILEHASRSARQLLGTLFSADGYTADVRIAPGPVFERREGRP
jgi:hypothetical protein